MKYLSYLLLSFISCSCSTIPDQSYHKIQCAIDDNCTEAELDAYSKPITNLGIVNGWSAESTMHKQSLEGRGNKFYVTPFKLQYLEYDESGSKLEETRQLNVINRAIATSNKPVYLVVYIHGWHNNASIDEKNLSLDTTGFPKLLARRSYQNPDMNVIGVYIGWRGEKYKYSPATMLSIKDRAKVADVIGNHGELRNDLVTLVNNVQNSTHSGYSLIIGHSLGGRLLSRTFMKDLDKTKSVEDWPLGQRSLLVTLNAAIGADAFDGVFKNMSGLGQNIERPLWLNLTSKDDDATSKLFPAARFIGKNVSDNPNSGKHQTVGHYLPYLSHEVTVIYGLDQKLECNFVYPDSILKNNTPWFKIPSRSPYTCGTRHLYEYTDFPIESRYYTTILRPLFENPDKPLGFMWNFRADKSVIDYSEAEAKISKSSGTHNAFVQTTLGRMLDDMLFTAPKKSSN